MGAKQLEKTGLGLWQIERPLFSGDSTICRVMSKDRSKTFDYDFPKLTELFNNGERVIYVQGYVSDFGKFKIRKKISREEFLK